MRFVLTGCLPPGYELHAGIIMSPRKRIGRPKQEDSSEGYMARLWKPDRLNELYEPFICHDKYKFGECVFSR